MMGLLTVTEKDVGDVTLGVMFLMRCAVAASVFGRLLANSCQ